jgi:hypothetical protein
MMLAGPVAWKAAFRSSVGTGLMRQGPSGKWIVVAPEPSGWGIQVACLADPAPVGEVLPHGCGAAGAWLGGGGITRASSCCASSEMSTERHSKWM